MGNQILSLDALAGALSAMARGFAEVGRAMAEAVLGVDSLHDAIREAIPDRRRRNRARRHLASLFRSVGDDAAAATRKARRVYPR